MRIKRGEAMEVEVHRFMIEASSLGLAPGNFPDSIETDLGNGQPFLRQSITPHYAYYIQALGCISLQLLND